MVNSAAMHIAEYSYILFQVVNEQFENSFLKDHSPDHLSRTQFSMLRILAIAKTNAVSELANVLNISRAAASKNVEKLVQQKLVLRQFIEEDRRFAKVSLTRKGWKLVELFDELSLNKQNEALKKFPEDDRIRFQNLFKQFVMNCLDNEKDVEAICIQCKGNLGGNCIISEYNQNCRFYIKNN